MDHYIKRTVTSNDDLLLFQIPICRYLCWILLGGEYSWNLVRRSFVE